MPRQCAVCISSDRLAFEAAVAAGSTVKGAALAAGLPCPPRSATPASTAATGR